jgi:hypothetical protein
VGRGLLSLLTPKVIRTTSDIGYNRCGKFSHSKGNKSSLKHCIFYILRYVSSLSSPHQFTNLGVFLYCPQARFLDCALTNDFREVLRLHPQADLEFLGELQLHFEHEISENELRLEAYIDQIGSYSNLIQISDPEVTVTDDLQAK